MNKMIRSFVFCTSLVILTATAIVGATLPWKNQLTSLFNRSEPSSKQANHGNSRQLDSSSASATNLDNSQFKIVTYGSLCNCPCEKSKKVFDPELLKTPLERNTPECERWLAQVQPKTKMVGSDFMFWK